VEEVAYYLRCAIQSGVYASGGLLPPERILNTELGIARPTLRQALDLLKNEGYLETQRGVRAGTYVTDLGSPTQAWLARMRADDGELTDIYQQNLMVEGKAAVLSAQRRTASNLEEMQLALDQLRVLRQLRRNGPCPGSSEHSSLRSADTLFHQSIALSCGSRRILEAVFWARGELFTAALLNLYDSELLGQILNEHETVFEAIRDADSHAALEAMTTHLSNGRQRLTRLLQGCVGPPGSALGGAGC